MEYSLIRIRYMYYKCKVYKKNLLLKNVFELIKIGDGLSKILSQPQSCSLQENHKAVFLLLWRRRQPLNERAKLSTKNLLYMSLTPVSHTSWQLRSDTPAPGQVVECVITACQSRRAEPVMQIEFSFHPYIMDCQRPSAMRRAPHCLYMHGYFISFMLY